MVEGYTGEYVTESRNYFEEQMMPIVQALFYHGQCVCWVNLYVERTNSRKLYQNYFLRILVL